MLVKVCIELMSPKNVECHLKLLPALETFFPVPK